LFSSQREAGEAAGFPRAVAAQRWADIESGRIANITLGTLARIAKALDEKPGDLLKP
jgi:DNA-binding Xre family transcriptional regulator